MGHLINEIFFVAIPVLLCLTLAFSVVNSQRANDTAQQLVKVNEQQKSIIEQQKKNLEATSDDVNDVRLTLLCIGAFFNNPDRTNITIESYAPCVLRNTVTGVRTQINAEEFTTPTTSTPPKVIPQ